MTFFLETKRLIIKAPTLSDYHDWCDLHAKSDVMPQTKEVVLEWLNHHIKEFQTDGYGMGSIFLKETNEFVGRAGLFHCPNENNQKSDVELGYIIRQEFWNKGFATEVAAALINKGFDDFNLDKILALTRPDNKKSIHILEKIGMRYVEKIRTDGNDYLLYEICKASS
jgi:ribosomal-protein-alanine N-acetyltransferase